MFKNLKIGVRLGLGFGITLALLTIISIMAITRIQAITAATADVVDDRMPKIDMSNEVQINVLKMARAVRNMILTDDKNVARAQKETIENARKKNSEILEKLTPALRSEKGKELVTSLNTARMSYVKTVDEMISLADIESAKYNQKKAVEFLFGDYVTTANEYVASAHAVAEYERTQARSAGKNALDIAASAKMVVLSLAIGAAIVATLFAWWVTVSITRPLGRAVSVANELAEGNLAVKLESSGKDEVGLLTSAMQNMVSRLTQIIGEVRNAANNLTNAAEQVSATAQSLSQSSSEQAASVEETTSSMEQMTSSISQNTENAKVTDGMASKAAQEATEGGEAVMATVEAMKSIADKISIIDDIAYQTNLLALNAAIEAARAGDHGKGFAVVAAEVRKLAERSQVAAQEIGDLASSSVKQAERAGTLLNEMVPSIRKTSNLVQEIAEASSEQSSGVSQINNAMGQLNQATQQNASASEELAATAEELGSQAEQLQQTMTFFRLDESVVVRPSIADANAISTLVRNPRFKTTRMGPVRVNEGDFERY